jgi:predicted Zn-dependent peptidase
VREPYFTDENVEKEKGIIGQEIKMYEDSPGWRVYFNLLEALYAEHPVRKDIAGTVESISGITPELLRTCYETFYHPENMILFGIGDEDREEFFARADAVLSERQWEPLERLERIFPSEPPAVAERRVEEKMVVSMPRVLIGFKDVHAGISGRELLARELAADILLELVFGQATEFYRRLYEEQLIDDGFHGSHSALADVGHSMVGGETPDPARLETEILGEIERVRRGGVAQEDFERQKRAVMGSFIRYFNSLEFTANNFCGYRFLGIDLLGIIDALHALELADLERICREHLDPARVATSVIVPRGDPTAAGRPAPPRRP